LLIFAFTLVFTLIGNVARVASIVLIAKMGFREFASGFYHDYSVFIIFFPVALASMVGFAKLLNMDYPKLINKMKGKKTATG
jgi:exosortase/archaeosortase family protein